MQPSNSNPPSQIILPPLSISLLNLVAAQDLARQIANGLIVTPNKSSARDEQKIAC